MMRTVLFVAIAILCASCRTDTQLDPIQTTTPIIDTAEISVREDCLYREVARLLERVQKFRIVGEDEADPKAGSISFASPVARLLMGKAVGDVAGAGQELEIIAIS